ncbi:Cof-type HAD-IIB family hydrolase [Sphingobacterium hungaricum]
MKTCSISNLLLLTLMLIASRLFSQQVNANNSLDSVALSSSHQVFENYKFILNGAMIARDKLVDYPGAILDRVMPYETDEKAIYQGVVYFHTPWYPPSPPNLDKDDVAYFINGVQVNSFAIRSTFPTYYTHMERLIQDTLINGKLYKGLIYVNTDEDFFKNRMSMPEIIKKYVGLPLEKVVVHWRGTFANWINSGVTIHDYFSLHFIDPKGLLEVKVDSLRFAEGEKYLVHLLDEGFRYRSLTENGWRPSERNYLIFNDPYRFDTEAPCYYADFDTEGKVFHRFAEYEPKPFDGEEAYLKKLSSLMELPTNDTNVSPMQDSIIVQFIVLADGQLTGLESVSPSKPGYANILKAIKKHSCVWSVASEDRTGLLFRRKMVIFYTEDAQGAIASLDELKYRYD